MTTFEYTATTNVLHHMANQPSTIPAPQSSAVVSLDQEDVDELEGHLSNLEGAANDLALVTIQLRRAAHDADSVCRAMRSIASRVRMLIGERKAALMPCSTCDHPRSDHRSSSLGCLGDTQSTLSGVCNCEEWTEPQESDAAFPLATIVTRWLSDNRREIETKGYTTVADILNGSLMNETSRHAKYLQGQTIVILKKLGWQRGAKRRDGNSVFYPYMPPPAMVTP